MGMTGKIVNKSLGLAVKGTWLAAKGTWHASVLAANFGFWGAHAAGKGVGLAYDLAKAPSVEDGDVRCPRGHLVPTMGIWRCATCDYIWEGSGWLCPNKNCRAPTSHLNCPECSLSVRNPYRLG